jgi:hypothetical protein
MLSVTALALMASFNIALFAAANISKVAADSTAPVNQHSLICQSPYSDHCARVPQSFEAQLHPKKMCGFGRSCEMDETCCYLGGAATCCSSDEICDKGICKTKDE